MGAVVPINLQRDQAKTVDRAGVLSEKISAALLEIKPDQEELKLLNAEMAGWYADGDPEKSHNVDGQEFMASVSPRQFEREIHSPLKAYKALKMSIGQFLSAVKIPLNLIDKHVPDENKQAAFLTKARTGARTVKLVRRAQQPEKAA